MFRFNRKKILPEFLNRRETVADFAREAGVSYQSAQRAVEGRAISAVIVSKVADALGINPVDYLADDSAVL